ncbi:MAG: ArsR/SmtB family transcription factor [Clostridium sp.]|uniref:ArsR/SmtB family transcription factor n=1 Tax=Clostridium sp. TaxID=1506 RepID=UPI003F39BDFE
MHSDIVKLFKALGDESRLKILFLISRKNVCAKGVSKHLGISEAAVSQHIKILKDANVIIGFKRGYFVHYSINYDVLDELINFTSNIKEPTSEMLNAFGLDTFTCEGKNKCQRKCNHANCERGN